MKVVLVGATGFVGRHLLAALHAAGHQLIATSRRPQPQGLPGVEWRQLDLDCLGREPQPFALPADTDLLINAAGLLSTDARALSLTQDLGTRALFDLAAARGVRVLQISALGAGILPQVPFLASKAAADDYLLQLGVPAVVLRPSLVLGAGGASSGWLTRLSPWPLIPLLSAKAQMQPLHIEDLSAAVLALLRQWPQESMVLPLVGPERMTMAQLLDHLRSAQGWGPARYFKLPAVLLRLVAAAGDRLGWRALNRQSLAMARHDNLADPQVLASVCGYHAAPLAARLQDWPQAAQSTQLALRPLLLAVMVLIWLGTALVCIGPGYDWGLRIMAEAGVQGVWAALAVIGGSLCDALLGVGLLLRRWRRRALQAQLGLMLGYTLIISLILPHFWFDPYAAVAKNLVLMVATLWLLWTEPPPMSAYLLLKTLHILSSTVLFGLGAGSAYYALRAWRSGRVEVIAVTFKHLVFADWAFTATTAIFQPLSGLGLVHLAGWSLQQAWLMWSLGLYVVAGLCWLPVVWLQIRVHKMAEQALQDGTPMPLRATLYMRWWFALGWPAFLAFMAIFYLMVAKPA